jgi:hypothetical protein
MAIPACLVFERHATGREKGSNTVRQAAAHRRHLHVRGNRAKERNECRFKTASKCFWPPLAIQACHVSDRGPASEGEVKIRDENSQGSATKSPITLCHWIVRVQGNLRNGPTQVRQTLACQYTYRHLVQTSLTLRHERP